MDNNKQRHEEIKKIVKHEKIFKQETLVDMLNKKPGIKVKQTTVSRDLRKLHIKKDTEKGFYVLSDQAKMDHLEKRLKTMLVQSECTSCTGVYVPIILKCEATSAPLICSLLEEYLEHFNQGQPVGAIAGPTGTIVLFVLEDAQQEIEKKLAELLSNLNS